MSGYDTLTLVNVTEVCDNGHSELVFQTKDLEEQGYHYVVFNNQLWLQARDGVSFKTALPFGYEGKLNAYTEHTVSERDYWIEYELEFAAGKLVAVVSYDKRLSADRSDKSRRRPVPLTAAPVVTVDFRGVDSAAYQAFHADLAGNLQTIRRAVRDARAEVVYPVKANPDHAMFSGVGPFRWVHSVTQSLEDFSGPTSGPISDAAGKPLPFPLMIDEWGLYSGIKET